MLLGGLYVAYVLLENIPMNHLPFAVNAKQEHIQLPMGVHSAVCA
jgi:hypothetical protein